MNVLSAEPATAMEADDGVVDISRVLAAMDFPWMALPAGPRRWAPADLSVELDGSELQIARMTYRTVGNRSVVIAGARGDVEVGWLAEQLSMPLLFAHFRRLQGNMSPGAIMAAANDEPIWDAPSPGGWRFGTAGVGSRPVRLAHLGFDNGNVVVASHGLALEEATTAVATLVPLEPGSDLAADLHIRHRQALAQRWWDAPRVPWTPEDRIL